MWMASTISPLAFVTEALMSHVLRPEPVLLLHACVQRGQPGDHYSSTCAATDYSATSTSSSRCSGVALRCCPTGGAVPPPPPLLLMFFGFMCRSREMPPHATGVAAGDGGGAGAGCSSAHSTSGTPRPASSTAAELVSHATTSSMHSTRLFTSYGGYGCCPSTTRRTTGRG